MPADAPQSEGDLTTEETLAAGTDEYIPGDRSDLTASLAAELEQKLNRVNWGERGVYLTAYTPTYRSVFREVIQYYQSVTDQELAVSYAAEWVLDNDYLVFQSLRLIDEDLPLDFNLQLPKLVEGPYAGLPRVYALAAEIIGHWKANLDLPRIEDLLWELQQRLPLSMGELWALPIMLHLGIIHSLCTATARLTGLDERLEPIGIPEIALKPDLTDDEIIANVFISLRTLLTYNWKAFFERLNLTDRILSDDPAGVYAEMEFVTRDQYRKVVEKISRATQRAEEEVAREAVRLAEAAAGSETAAGAPQGTAEGSTAHHVGEYLLGEGVRELEARMGRRLNVLERFGRWIQAHPTVVYLGGIALLSLAVFALFIWYAAVEEGTLLHWRVLLAAVLSAGAASATGVQLVNWVMARLIKPKPLPKMDYSEGLPKDQAALVVIPALLGNEKMVKSLVRQLELHYLRNPDANLRFVLLSDLTDAPQKSMPEDSALLELAAEEIHALNRKYARSGGNGAGEPAGPFLFLHRDRVWNESEEAWIGWERKRGKLHQLNELILHLRSHMVPGETPDKREPVSITSAGFSAYLGDLTFLSKVRYVITLDADTILPPESACRLVGTLAHPLNRAQFGRDGRLKRGYTILQPRTEVNPEAVTRTPFTRIFSGDLGLDLYTQVVSDVYQDLYGESIYMGKGIYDVEAFERSLKGKVPENTLLSHDLFEGTQGRAGFVSDVVLIEDYPTNYLAHARRLHRWMRGDWQLVQWLIPWILRRIKGYRQRKVLQVPARMAWVHRWMIVDNLRRSLTAPGLLLLFAFAWTGLLPGSPWFWTIIGVIGLAMPLVTEILDRTARILRLQARNQETSEPERLLGRVSMGFRGIGASLLRLLLALAFLPFEAVLSAQAVLVTLWRILVTRKYLLTWTSAALSEEATNGSSGETRRKYWMEMISGPAIAAAIAVAIAAATGVLAAAANPWALLPAVPFLIGWLISPEIAYRLSVPQVSEAPPVTEESLRKLREIARRTWLFFEQFIGPEDHWLPPDHFQESPLGLVAHRTSPTNIGLNLLSMLAAYDFGYIGLLGLSARLRSSLDGLAELERYRGHFLNWYDTRTLEPLNPPYISTVDSGNLAACLVAMRQGLFELAYKPVLRWETFQGILDTLLLVCDLLSELEDFKQRNQDSGLWKTLGVIVQQTESLPGLEEPLAPQAWAGWLASVREDGESGSSAWMVVERELLETIEAVPHSIPADYLRRLQLYLERARRRIDNAVREVETLQPWIFDIAQPPEIFRNGGAGEEAWNDLLAEIPLTPSLNQMEQAVEKIQAGLGKIEGALEGGIQNGSEPESGAWFESIRQNLDSSIYSAKSLLVGMTDLAEEADGFFRDMDFSFLFDRDRQVFHIGYNLSTGRLDNNYYDLLASEARIASLIAIAKGDVPVSHWLHLSRPLTLVDGKVALLSWSATMFEYLMPELLLDSAAGTLLAESIEAAVDYQIAYGSQNGYPWGISESGYYRFDPSQAYQYQAFGVPGLGYKRGLGDNAVIAPYAAMLALNVRPLEVIENIAALEKLGALGTYGFYEAIDFTTTRLPLGRKYELVKEYMAHHQGMILLSLVNYLKDEVMVRRFHADPRIQSVDLLLHEQVPDGAPIQEPHADEMRAIRPEQPRAAMDPWRVRINAPQPRVLLLSNGRFTTLLTAAGGGFSTWLNTDLTRWNPDTTRGNWGSWVYIKDMDNHKLWSAGYLPTHAVPEKRDVYFNAHAAAFSRLDDGILTSMDVTVAPDDDVEVRLVTLSNTTGETRRLRLTSYGEVILTPQATDRRHPAFNKLFIESEYVPAVNALLFKRRPRTGKEPPVVLAHVLITEEGLEETCAYESDRARFTGRGRNTSRPQALEDPSWLSGTAGATLDPIFALGQEVTLPPHSARRMALLTMAAPTREEVLALAERYRIWQTVERTFDRAHARVELDLRYLGLDSVKLPRINHLLSALMFPHPVLRAHAEVLGANTGSQRDLWAYAISGDYPIILVKVGRTEGMALLNEILQAHAYWRTRGLLIDLVLLNEQGSDYGQALNSQLYRALEKTGADAWLNRRGGIFLLMSDRLRPADRTLLESAARVNLDAERGSLADLLPHFDRLPLRLPDFNPTLPGYRDPEPTGATARPRDLLFDNGFGGFSPDGREYQIYLPKDVTTPAPWINVIANPEFGFLATESGLGFTWAGNSGENKLTPWSNDPISDPPGEAVYIRDEETAVVWSPTPKPTPAPNPYLVRHGAGYSIFEHLSHGLDQTLKVFALPDEPVKVINLTLENMWKRERRITVTYYAEWVLGVNREDTQQYVIPEFDAETQALLARNPYRAEFARRVAFAAASKKLHGLTSDRAEFLGRMRDPSDPAGLRRIGLTGTVRAGLDPCAALQLHVDLQPGETTEVYFLLGQGADRHEAVDLVRKYQDAETVRRGWDQVRERWEELLSTVQVKTPDPTLDLVINRWLLYQALSCRIWGRSGFYQVSGAYGFRDQLQDVTSVIHAAPEIAREHILRAAHYQFETGDVLHWWHPPGGTGVRTRFSDDLLWLPYATAHYIEATGDISILGEQAPFLQAPPLEEHEEERYGQFPQTESTYSLYEHCFRAIERGSTIGRHGLPLMGAGDWNDGMNRVDDEGKGESVWLAWFLIDVLNRFADIAERTGLYDQAYIFRERANRYRRAVEAHAWDGEWYLRAFYDDGSPLGSAVNNECRIDSLSQSWALISGAGEPERSRRAMQSVFDLLVREDDRLILLFTPPFDKTRRDPGYIKGYVPGIRENGGQYTHAAIWTVWATTLLGDGDRAWKLFQMLNPVNHAKDPEEVVGYKVEPYVVAADVYGAPPHTGRGGWTWYTGSSGWLYRLGLEAILGVRREGQGLRIEPCIPASWGEYEITYRYRGSEYHIRVLNPDGVSRGVTSVHLDGRDLPEKTIPLSEGAGPHEVVVVLGATTDFRVSE